MQRMEEDNICHDALHHGHSEEQIEILNSEEEARRIAILMSELY